jgi:hypothetical protein
MNQTEQNTVKPLIIGLLGIIVGSFILYFIRERNAEVNNSISARLLAVLICAIFGAAISGTLVWLISYLWRKSKKAE